MTSVDCVVRGSPDLSCIYVDSMLGWLAKFLRIVFGLRVIYRPDLEDRELSTTPCLVVTMDGELFKIRKAPTVLFKTGDHVKWIAAFIHMGAVPFARSLCPTCGGELARVDCREAEQSVGHEIRSSQCWRCMSCSQVYWRGSHWRRITKLVEEASTAEIICLHID